MSYRQLTSSTNAKFNLLFMNNKRFLQKNLMSSNQLCMIFKDKATADLNN